MIKFVYNLQMKIFIPVLLSLIIVSCYKSEEILYIRAFYIMGSEFQYKLYCKHKSTCEKAVSESQKKLNHIDYLFSNYRDDSVLYKVNSNAAKAPIAVPAEFLGLTEESIRYSELTMGSFDISIGKLFELWKKSSSVNKLPDKSQIDRALECTGYKKIIIDKVNSTVSFDSQCLELGTHNVKSPDI